jgi:RNA polymerase sigma factor (sigma-70 family)
VNIEKDQILLEGLARNERAAIEAIYKDNFNMVQSFILNNNGSTDDARDIFQEAMIVLYEKSRDSNFILHCQLKTYVYSVCRRLWLKRLQQMNRFTGQVESLEEVVPVEEELEQHEKLNTDFMMMENAMSKIGEPCKSLLEAYYIQKSTCRKLLKVLDIPMLIMQKLRNINV